MHINDNTIPGMIDGYLALYHTMNICNSAVGAYHWYNIFGVWSKKYKALDSVESHIGNCI